MKSLGVYYWCVKIPKWGYMEHGLKYIAFYVKKIAPSAICYNLLLIRDKPLGVLAFVKLIYSLCFEQCVYHALVAKNVFLIHTTRVIGMFDWPYCVTSTPFLWILPLFQTQG